MARVPALWGPFTSLQDVLQRGPLVIERADGVRVYDRDGNEFIDAHGGLWLVNVGYGRQEIVNAMFEQAGALTWFPSFGGFANPPALSLAEKLRSLFADDGMATVFFSGSGSEANETALKLVRQYWRIKNPAKYKLIGRRQAYHGVTLGALSVAGIPGNREPFEPLLPQVRHIPAPDHLHCPYHAGGAPCTLACADELERTILFEGPETVAAFIMEPVQGAGGVIIPPPDYMARVRAICDRYHVLLISDEVICGFGRLGTWSGARFYGVRPDVMTFAKGLTSGYFPLGATMVTGQIAEAFLEHDAKGPEFRHGNTYSGHPVGAAAALANIAILEGEGILEHVQHLDDPLHDALSALRDRHAGDVADADSVGLLGRVELSGRPNGPTGAERAAAVAAEMRKNGVIARPAGAVVTLSPPLIISEADLLHVVDVLDQAITATRAV
jgi:adenosylmethionine-8-amino-7-oxononanoate aminotransferase